MEGIKEKGPRKGSGKYASLETQNEWRNERKEKWLQRRRKRDNITVTVESSETRRPSRGDKTQCSVWFTAVKKEEFWLQTRTVLLWSSWRRVKWKESSAFFDDSRRRERQRKRTRARGHNRNLQTTCDRNFLYAQERQSTKGILLRQIRVKWQHVQSM